MKHYIILIHYKVPFEQFESIVPIHREHLQRGVDAGIVLLSGPRVPRKGGVIIAKAESPDVIHNLIEDDPYKVNGVAEYEIIEFSPGRRQSFLSPWIDD